MIADLNCDILSRLRISGPMSFQHLTASGKNEFLYLVVRQRMGCKSLVIQVPNKWRLSGGTGSTRYWGVSPCMIL